MGRFCFHRSLSVHRGYLAHWSMVSGPWSYREGDGYPLVLSKVLSQVLFSRHPRIGVLPQDRVCHLLLRSKHSFCCPVLGEVPHPWWEYPSWGILIPTWPGGTPSLAGGCTPWKGPGTRHWGSPQKEHWTSGSVTGWRWGTPQRGHGTSGSIMHPE